MDWFVHEELITGGEGARDSWRALFAETLLRWKEMEKGNHDAHDTVGSRFDGLKGLTLDYRFCRLRP